MSDVTPPVPPAPGPPMSAKDAKAHAKASKAYAKAQRPFWKKKRFIIPVALVVLIGVGAATSGSSEDEPTNQGGSDDGTGETSDRPDNDFSSNEDNPPEADVDDVSCDVDEFGFVTGTVTVTNNSSKESNYLFTVNIERNGTVVGEAIGSQDNVDAGQTAEASIGGTISGEGEGNETCVLEEVERFAS